MPTATANRKSTKSRKTGSSKSKVTTKQSASATVKEVAEQCNVSYRKARRIARDIGLGVGKGARYDSLNKRQVSKLVKTLSA